MNPKNTQATTAAVGCLARLLILVACTVLSCVRLIMTSLLQELVHRDEVFKQTQVGFLRVL